MEFAVLGPLRASIPGGGHVVLGSRHQSIVLATLLFHANEWVSIGRFVEALWGDTPPDSHVSNLHTYVARLRKRCVDVKIDYVDRCYRLSVPSEKLDLLVFRHEASTGREALRAGDPVTASTHFRRALSLWRARPLADLSVMLFEPEIVRLEQERLTLLEDYADSELAVERHGELVPELQALVSEYPLRERLRAQLMIALHQAGRQADALVVYREARAVLVEELGIEPGPELQRVHEAILQGRAPGGAVLTGGSVSSVFPICQLPPCIADFYGRAEQIDVLADWLGAQQLAVPVVVISGEPGVGKSALALRVAHDIRKSFPDGQLFVQLAGASQSPRSPVDVLGEFLRELGMVPSVIPGELEARAAAFRARLADRRVLLVLDDAAGVEQVCPLLAGTAGCAVLVTSRSRLSGLTGARTLSLASLSDSEAGSLLAGMLGAARVAGELDATARIIAACGGLPLALRIAGARLALRSHVGLGSLADRLDIERRRLDEFAVGNMQVRASLASSYHSLSPLARSAFSFLGVLGAVDVAGWTVGVLLDVPDADAVIEELVEANLLQPMGQDATGEPRYRLHDLLRVYAVERAEAESSEEARLAVHRRCLDALLGLANRAAPGIGLSFSYRRLKVVPPLRLPDDLVRRLVVNPITWFAAERLNLLAAVRSARIAHWHGEADLLTHLLTEFLWERRYWTDLHGLHHAVQEQARRSGDELTEVKTECVLAALRFAQGDEDDLSSTYERCFAIIERLGNQDELGCMLIDRTRALVMYGLVDEALRYAIRAEEVFRTEGEIYDQAAASSIVMLILAMLGRLDQAFDVSGRAVTLARESGDLRLQALSLSYLARLHLARDEPYDSLLASKEAEDVLTSVGDRTEARWASLRTRAFAEAALSHRSTAVQLFEQAHVLAKELALPSPQAVAERELAACWIGDGRAAEAAIVLRRTVDKFRDFRLAGHEAVSLKLLAVAYEALGQPVEAEAVRLEAECLAGTADPIYASAVKAILVLTVDTTRGEHGSPATRRVAPATMGR